MILGGSKQVSLDLLHPTDETRLVLRSLGKMPFKNSLSEVLDLILAFWPLPTLYHSKIFTELIHTSLANYLLYSWIKGGSLKLEKQWGEGVGLRIVM